MSFCNFGNSIVPRDKDTYFSQYFIILYFITVVQNCKDFEKSLWSDFFFNYLLLFLSEFLFKARKVWSLLRKFNFPHLKRLIL